MKKSYIIVFAAIASLFFSCKKAKEVLDITRPFAINNEFNLPKIADEVIAETLITISQADIPNTLPEEFKKNNVNIDKIKSVKLDSVVFKIKAPEGQNFGFMKSIKLYIGSAGKGEKLIASKDNINIINPSPKIIILNVEDSNIAEYIKSNTYDIKIQMLIVKTYNTDITISSDIKGKVVANPIN